MFNFKRKTKEGKEENLPVTQEEFDALQANAATLDQVLELFGEDAQQADFDVAVAIQDLIDSNAAIGEAFGEAATAEDFDAVATITALQESNTELSEIESLVSTYKGKTTLEKVKSINPASKTTVVKKGKETTSADSTAAPTFQDYRTNRKAIEELQKRGVELASVDYTTLN